MISERYFLICVETLDSGPTSSAVTPKRWFDARAAPFGPTVLGGPNPKPPPGDHAIGVRAVLHGGAVDRTSPPPDTVPGTGARMRG